jgi:uridine kinase
VALLIITPNYRKLLADLAQAIDRSRFMLIGIEGRMLEGKSCLAKRLKEDLRLHAIHVDDYRPKPILDLPYLKTLDIPALVAHLDEIQSEFPTTPLIIEGICLREVLDAIARKLDLSIYVKKLSPQGLWHFQFDIEDYNNDPRSMGNMPRALYKDEMRYHREFEPHERADFYFEWTE